MTVSRVGTSRRDVLALRAAAIAVTAVAAIALGVPGDAGDAVARLAVALAVGAPLARVVRVAAGFVVERDWRFAALAFAVLAVVAGGTVLAAVL